MVLPETAPRRRVQRRSVVAALHHHSPPYNLPLTQIWVRLDQTWQRYRTGTIVGVVPTKMPLRCHIRHRCTVAALLHHSPSYKLPYALIWARLRLLNQHHFESDAAGNGGVIISHPMIYLRLEFEPDCTKNNFIHAALRSADALEVHSKKRKKICNFILFSSY